MASHRPTSSSNRLRRLAWAAVPAACMLMADAPALAGVTVTGPYWLDPNPGTGLGPGNVDLPGSQLYLNPGSSFSATAGASVALRLIATDGTMALSGAGTVLALFGDGYNTRLEVGQQGVGSLSVSAGATLDGRANAAACLLGPRNCAMLVGNAAGSTGVLTVTDAGSSASFLGGFYVGGLAGLSPGFGTPGGLSQGTVNVLNGGLLRTDFGSLGVMTQNGLSLGTERIQATVNILGTGSTWQITGSSLDSNGAFLDLAQGQRTLAAATVGQGGLLSIASAAGRHYGLHLGWGGEATLDVNGAGSTLLLLGDTDRGDVSIASQGGTGVLTVRDGGTLASTARSVSVGGDRGNGRLTVSGAGSSASFSPLTSVSVGDGGTGRLEVLAGGNLSAAQLNVGLTPGGPASVLVSGKDATGNAATLSLGTSGNHRIRVGNGSITVADGGVIDARVNAADCAGGVWCATQIGAQAGANGSLTVTGAGSRASFIGNFQAGITSVATPAIEGWTDGIVGGQTVASVQVLDGGLIQAGTVQLGLGTFSASADGTEGAVVNLAVRGAGSRFLVTGDGLSANFSTVTYNAKNTVVNIGLSDGGRLQLQGADGRGALMTLSSREGLTQLSARGTGTTLEFGAVTTGTNQIAAGTNGGTARLSFAAGAALTGAHYLSLGFGGGLGDLKVDGAGSRVEFNTAWAALDIGRRGGQGSASVTGGAQLLMNSNQVSTLRVGFQTDASGAPGTGSLSLSGAGSLLSLRSGVAGDAATANPLATIGFDGSGSLSVRNGAVFRIEGLAPASPALGLQGAGLVVGSGSTSPASGRADVSGADSRVDVLGTHPFITVGTGKLASGQLNIGSGAVVQATLMGIADAGASGSVRIDNASLKLDGAWRDGTSIGASLSVGAGSGSAGTLTLTNGSQLLIANAGTERTNLSLGGLDYSPGGSGVLSVSGGSTVGVGGAGGGQFIVGMTSGGVGVATFSGGSSLTAGYVGVGARDGHDSGGVGTLIINDTSTLTATTLEVGAKGYVGGTGTIHADVVNRGVFSPGNSPGTLTIDGSFSAQAGSRLVLEVQADGQGGFVTDQLMFGSGHAVNLSGLAIEFRFLGGTDPNAFRASGGFDVDHFVTAGGAALPDAVFDGVQFSASAADYTITNFSYSAGTGAVFQAQAVPEPSTGLLLITGGLAVGGAARRRASRAQPLQAGLPG